MLASLPEVEFVPASISGKMTDPGAVLAPQVTVKSCRLV
jgi:hypothetical protein